MINTEAFDVFSQIGSLTDHYLTAERNKYAKADNLIMNAEFTLVTRPGSVCYDVANAQLPTGNQRVNAILNYNVDTALIASSGTRAFRYSAGWSELLGPSGAVAFDAGSAASRVSSFEWLGHLFLTNDGGATPVKMYRDSGGTYRLVRAGLPRFPNNRSAANKASRLAEAITLANGIRTAMITHYASAAAHTIADPYNATVTATPVASDEATLITLTRVLMEGHRLHIADARSFSSAYHLPVPTLGHFFLKELPPPSDVWTAAAVLNELKKVFNYHHDSFAMSPSFASTMDTHIHLVDTGLVATASVVLEPTPVLDATTDSLSLMYLWADELRGALRTHYLDIAGAGGHAVATGNEVTSVTIDSEHTMVLGYYKLLYGYARHRLWDAHHKVGSTEPATSALTLSVALNGSELPLRAVDLTTAAGCNTVLTDLNDLITKGTIHAVLGAAPNDRHIASGDVLSSHTTNGAWYLLMSGTGNQTFVSYLYGFTYRNKYTTYGGLDWFDVSTPYVRSSGPTLKEFRVYNVGATQYETVTTWLQWNSITALPATNHNPSTTATKEIYRSIADGTVLYKVDEIANATTSFVDRASDTFVQTQPKLYTTDGVVSNDAPPLAKYIHTVNNRGYYGCITTEYNEVLPNRLVQSVTNDLDSCPGSFYLDFPQPILGVSSAKGNPIVWTATKTYRVQGSLDLFGRGSMEHIVIHDAVGLAASYSPVQVEGGVVFWGTDGIYFTNSYEVRRIGAGWRETAMALLSTSTKAANIQGTWDRTWRRVWWGVSEAGAENDKAYILDLDKPMNENCVVTTASNGTYFAPTAFCYYAGQIIRGDSRGYILKHDDLYYSDPKINTGAAANTWSKRWIVPLLRSVAFDFGNFKDKKWVTKISSRYAHEGTNLSIQINGINDDAASSHACTPIRYRGSAKLVEEQRHFNAQYQILAMKQVEFTLAKVVLSNPAGGGLDMTSVNFGAGVYDGVAKTVTAGVAWPADLEDQYILFDADGYTHEFQITSVVGTVLTFADPGGVAPAPGVHQWVIKGYPKDERMHLLGYTVHVDFLGQTQQSAAGESGMP